MSDTRTDAQKAVDRIDDWNGADHYEDCAALPHADHECGCPDTDEGESTCADLEESSCDCYLGAMRTAQAAIRSLVAELEAYKRAKAENDERFTYKQVKLEKDGIHMTPDGFDPVAGEVISYKSTRRSVLSAVRVEFGSLMRDLGVGGGE